MFVEVPPRKKMRLSEEDAKPTSSQLLEEILRLQKLSVLHQAVQNRILLSLLEAVKKDGQKMTFADSFEEAEKEFGTVLLGGKPEEDPGEDGVSAEEDPGEDGMSAD